jgi:DNA-binding XRE family transcriptional regulator
MASFIHATGKRPHHTYRVYGTWGERRLPEVRSKSDLYDLLRRELGMAPGASRTDVVMALLDRDWDQAKQQWVDDFRMQLKQARAEAGLSQAELAARAGLSLQAVAGYEQGSSSPTWGVVRKLSRALDKQFTVTSVKEIPEEAEGP